MKDTRFEHLNFCVEAKKVVLSIITRNKANIFTRLIGVKWSLCVIYLVQSTTIQLITLDNTRRIPNNNKSFRQFFENCFHMYYEGLHRYAYTLVKDNHDACDIVQLVFTKWWEKGETLIIQQDIRHYLYRTVHNQCLNFTRNKKNRKTYSYDFASNQESTAVMESGDPLISKEIVNKVNRELENLPPQCKLIFYKSRFEEKRYAEIASELNLSIKTVEAQIGKALKILREKLFEDNVSILLFLICFLNKLF